MFMIAFISIIVNILVLTLLGIALVSLTNAVIVSLTVIINITIIIITGTGACFEHHELSCTAAIVPTNIVVSIVLKTKLSLYTKVIFESRRTAPKQSTQIPIINAAQISSDLRRLDSTPQENGQAFSALALREPVAPAERVPCP